MKPTFKTTALAILISLGAVACGSSGGGSSSTEQKQPVVKQNPKLQKQESNKTTAVKTENKKANSEQDKLQAQIKQLQDRINELQQKIDATPKTADNSKLADYEKQIQRLNKDLRSRRYKMLWDSATRVGYPADKVNDFVERHVDDQDLKAYRRELRDFQIKIDAENAGMTKEEVKSFVEKHKNDEYLYSYLDEIDKIKFLTRAEDEGMTKEEAKAFYDKYNSDEDRMALNDAFNQYVIKKIAFNEALNHGMSEKEATEFLEKHPGYSDIDINNYFENIERAMSAGMSQEEAEKFVENHYDHSDWNKFYNAISKYENKKSKIDRAIELGMSKSEAENFYKKYNDENDSDKYYNELNRYFYNKNEREEIRTELFNSAKENGLSDKDAKEFAEKYSSYEEKDNRYDAQAVLSKKHGTFEEALKAGMNKEDAKVFAEKHYNDDEDIKTQAQKDFIAKKSADAEKLRKDFVGKRVIKNQLLKIDNNGYNKFSTSEITADGYSRTESPVEIRKYKDITDENKKPVSLSYTSYVYNLEDAGIEFSNVNYSGYKNTYKHGAKISYAGYPTKSDALKDLSGTAQYNGRAFVVSSYYGDKDLDDAKVSLTADFNKKEIGGEITYYFNYPTESKIQLEKGKIQAKNDQIVFNGEAKAETGGGTYEGKFMGKEAKQLAGSVKLNNSYGYGSNVSGAVFVAEKQ